MRGRMAPNHCASELPHGADHSSPASFQSYFIRSYVGARYSALHNTSYGLTRKLYRTLGGRRLGFRVMRRHGSCRSAFESADMFAHSKSKRPGPVKSPAVNFVRLTFRSASLVRRTRTGL